MNCLSLLSRHRRWRISTIVFVAVVAVLACVASACNVPVFRFALERWRPDAYRVTLLHRGPLSDEQAALVARLQAVQEKNLGNLTLRIVDAAQLAPPHAGQPAAKNGLWQHVFSRLENGEPWLVVQYPEHLQIEAPVWTGPLSEESVMRLLDSPVRQELMRRLVGGQTAVWLLLESGHADQDDAAAARLAARLNELQQSLQLPELTSDPADELLASTPLKIAFSVLRVPKNAAEEDPLVGMLVRSEEDLAEQSQPLVFPVFGRGRALLPLVGAGISAENIHEAAAFLVGPCSCQVKELNPGFDLLLSAEWEAMLSGSGQHLIAKETRGRSAAAASEIELVPIPPGAHEETQPAASPPGSYTWIFTGGILLGLAAFVVVLAAMHAGKS